MTERRGPLHWRAGPRLPSAPRIGYAEKHHQDGAEHCLACGATKRLYLFELSLGGRPAGWMRLCEPCYRWTNPPDPQATDPLHVEAA